MKVSAISTCSASSRARTRTNTFVSAARMLLPQMRGDRLVHLLDSSTLRSPFTEHSLMNLYGGEATSPSHLNGVAFCLPIDGGTRRQPEAGSHLGWNRDLTLWTDPGRRDLHLLILPW